MENNDRKYNYTMGMLSALGIIFVVLGHVGSTVLTFDNWLPYYSFHMPLFLFISGYFYNEANEEKCGKYIWKKVKRLLVPFYIWNAIYLTIQTILNNCFAFNIGHKLSFDDLFVRPWTYNQPIGFNVATWFLIALFITEVINCILRKIIRIFKCRNEWFITALYFLIALTMMVLQKKGYFVEEWQWTIPRSLFLMFFFQTGHLFKKELEKHFDKINGVLLFAVLLVAQTLIKFKFENITYGVFHATEDPSIFVRFIEPFIGIFFWLKICKIFEPVIAKSSALVSLGKNTISIMIHHLFVIFLMQTVLAFGCKYFGMFDLFDIQKYKTSVYYMYPQGKINFLFAVLSIAIILFVCEIRDRVIKKIREKRNSSKMLQSK